MNEEIWKPVIGWEGLYEVSNLGRIRSLDRWSATAHGDGQRLFPGRVKKQTIDPKGYPRTILVQRGLEKKFSGPVHRLIAIAFIPNPDNLPQVNHKNAIKTDNRVENLEWCTNEYNMQHKTENGLCNPLRGTDCNFAILNNAQVLEIRKTYSRGAITQQALADRYGISKDGIHKIVNRKTWTHI